MKKILTILLCCAALVHFWACEKEPINGTSKEPEVEEEPVVSEDILKNYDIVGHKLLHVIDVSSDEIQDLVIPSVFDAASISVTSTDSSFSCEELTVGGERVLRFEIDLPEGESKRIIPVKVTIDEVSEEYSRNFFILAIDTNQATEVKSDAITSVYSQSMGRGTFSYGSLGNVTYPIFDYDMLTSYGTKYITAERPARSSDMFERSGTTYSETITDWSFDMGTDFKQTLGTWSKDAAGKKVFNRSTKSISGSADYGMSSDMERDASFEYYFNYYKVQCQNIKINVSSFSSTQYTNIKEADTTFLSLITPSLISQFQNSSLDADNFVKEWGTDIIYKALYGGAYINYYARSENSYAQSVMYDADASLSFKNNSGNAAAGQWLTIFKSLNSDHVSSTADMSYMSSQYQKASNYREGSVSFGGNYQNDVDEWVDGFSTGDNDDASTLSVIISYKLTSDTSAEDEEFSLYQMDIFCADLYNAIVMLYNEKGDLTESDTKALETIADNVDAISAARQALLEANVEEIDTTKPRIILADFMMVAESNDNHESGRPQPFVAEDPNRSGEYLIYYPIIANKYAPGSGVQGYALDTSVSEYIETSITHQAHVWYYALGREGVVNPVKDILFCESPSDDSMVRRGDLASQGVASLIRDNGVWLKFDKVANSSGAITAVCIMADDDGVIVGSSGGAEINGSPSPEKLEVFDTFWADGYKKYTGDEYCFYEKGWVLYGHYVYAGYSTKDLPVDRLNEATVDQPKTW